MAASPLYDSGECIYTAAYPLFNLPTGLLSILFTSKDAAQLVDPLPSAVQTPVLLFLSPFALLGTTDAGS